MVFSIRSRLCTKVVWLGRISSFRMGLSLATRIFKMVLYMVEQQEIWRYSDIAEAPGCLGTRERMVELATTSKKPIVKKVPIEDKTSRPMIDQEALKNPEVRPSGTQALFGFNLRRVVVIFSDDGKADMIEICCGEQRNDRIEANHRGIEIVMVRSKAPARTEFLH